MKRVKVRRHIRSIGKTTTIGFPTTKQFSLHLIKNPLFEHKKHPAKRQYKTTIQTEFGLTQFQIENAIQKGILHYEIVENPHYKGGRPSILLFTDEVKRKLEILKSLPRFSHEEMSRKKLYVQRSKKRSEIEFYCENCGENIRALPKSQAFEGYFHGELSAEKAIEFLKKAHDRHVHSEYDDFRTKRVTQLRAYGLSWEEAHEQARNEARQKLRQGEL